MKLKKVIKYLDRSSHCKIWINDEQEPVYEGYIWKIPWTFLDDPLNNDDDGEAIWASYDEKATNANYRSYFAIYLKEED